MKHRIVVSSPSHGHDLAKIVEADSLAELKHEKRVAIVEWCELNKIDLESQLDLPVVTVSEIKDGV